MFMAALFVRAPSGNKSGGLTNEVLAYHGILLGNTKEQTTDKGNNSNKPWSNYAEWKKTISHDYIVYDPLYSFVEMITLQKWEQVCSLHGLGMRG